MNKISIVLFALAVSLVGCSSLIADNQYEALMDLYKATGGEGWTYSFGWGTNDNYCTWHAVGCDKDSFVKSLSLSSNNLTGTIPESIGYLTRLQVLGMEFNNINGAIP